MCVCVCVCVVYQNHFTVQQKLTQQCKPTIFYIPLIITTTKKQPHSEGSYMRQLSVNHPFSEVEN